MEMNHHLNDRASYITFENIYDDRELQLIWQEAEFLCHHDKFLVPLRSGSALDTKGNVLKSNKCLWMDSIYSNRNISNYLKLYKKSTDYVVSKEHELTKVDLTLKLFFQTTKDTTLVSYYENEDYYDFHSDKSCYTYIFWLFKEPKLFSGGNLTFKELNQTINVKSNMAILFPSWLDHAVDKIEMCDTIEKYKCNGRFSFTTFFSYIG